MFCPRCGSPCQDQDSYCPRCGAPVSNPDYPFGPKTPIYPQTPQYGQTPPYQEKTAPSQSGASAEEKKTRTLKVALIAVLSTCFVLMAVAVGIVFSLIASRSRSNDDVQESVVADVPVSSEPSEQSPAAEINVEPSEPSEDSPEETSVMTAETPVVVSEPSETSEPTEQSKPAVSSESSVVKEISDQERYRRLKIPENTDNFVRSRSNLQYYSVADLDGDNEFELITISSGFEIALYQYDWDENNYCQFYSFSVDKPNSAQGDQFELGIKDGNLCYRFYDFSSSSDTTADVMDTYCDVLESRDWKDSYVKTMKKDKIWYDRDVNEIILFDASYHYTKNLVLPDLQSRELSREFLLDLMEAHGYTTKKEKSDFLDEIINETAGLKGFIFQRGFKNYTKFMETDWYETKYYSQFEKELTGKENDAEYKEKIDKYNHIHYWNNDRDKPSPLSTLYEEVNSPVIQALSDELGS